MQVTVTGHLPGVVVAPTFQVQLTEPAASAVFGSSPLAALGPESYVTTMLHDAFGAVVTSTVAGFPPEIGDVRDTILTESLEAAWP